MIFVQCHTFILNKDGIDSTLCMAGVSLARRKHEFDQTTPRGYGSEKNTVDRAGSSETTSECLHREAEYIVDKIVGQSETPTDRQNTG